MNKLLKFWQSMEKQPNTEIVKEDYEILNRHNLLISANRWKQVCNDKTLKGERDAYKLHAELLAEPFDGDIENAKIYIVSINPHAGNYLAEYTNNFYHPVLGPLLEDKIIKNRYQQNKDYPFYYLDPKLIATGGGHWWRNQRLQGVIDVLKHDYDITDYEAAEFIAKNVFDLELCPYHSESWDSGSKDAEIISTLPSVQVALDFVKNTIIPGVIDGSKKLIMLNGTPTLNGWIGDTTFEYCNKNISFEQLYSELSDEKLDKNLSEEELNEKFADIRMICYWKQNRNFAQKALITAYDKKTNEIKKYPAGRLLITSLKSIWEEEHKQ
ncbi:MAG: hypothetical protein J5613_04140 [Alphaproteobacteria bacterium]|nr:hypothetical protein [Alphaproteobacteria bacterium]